MEETNSSCPSARLSHMAPCPRIHPSLPASSHGSSHLLSTHHVWSPEHAEHASEQTGVWAGVCGAWQTPSWTGTRLSCPRPLACLQVSQEWNWAQNVPSSPSPCPSVNPLQRGLSGLQEGGHRHSTSSWAAGVTLHQAGKTPSPGRAAESWGPACSLRPTRRLHVRLSSRKTSVSSMGPSR